MRVLIIAVTVIAFFGVAACDDANEPANDARTPPPTFAAAPTTPTVPETSVFLFSSGPVPSVKALLDTGGVAFLEWLEDGKSIVGYDWEARAYSIVDVATGKVLGTFAAETTNTNMRTAFAHPVPGGKFIVIEHDDGSVAGVYDLAANEDRAFSGPPGNNGGFEPSPDGTSVAFNNLTAGRTTAMISNIDGTGFRVLRGSEDGNVGVIWHTWSPDGSWLLMNEFPNVEACAPNCNRMGSYIVTDTKGVTVWRLEISALKEDEFIDLQWAGTNRLLLTSTRADPSDGSLVMARSTFIDIPSGNETSAPAELAVKFVSMSPDGRHAIMRLGDGDGAWEQRCSLVEIDPLTRTITELIGVEPRVADFQTVFCSTVDWTAGGTQAIVSAGGI